MSDLCYACRIKPGEKLYQRSKDKVIYAQLERLCKDCVKYKKEQGFLLKEVK